jgi:hypothetical protein
LIRLASASLIGAFRHQLAPSYRPDDAVNFQMKDLLERGNRAARRLAEYAVNADTRNALIACRDIVKAGLDLADDFPSGADGGQIARIR